MKKYLESIKSFFVLTICFTIVLFCIKSFELLTSDAVSVTCLLEMVYSNLIASLLLGFCVFIIFNIISIFSKKVATYFCSILFSIIIISEISLIFYFRSTGLMMGNELIERPLWETITTIKSVLNFWMIAAAILFIIAFTFVNQKIIKRQSQGSTAKVILLLMLISIPLFFVIKPNQNNDAVNKIWYCFYSCFMEKDTEINLSKLEFNKDKIQQYKSIFPEREILDDTYPLERTDNINNVLGQYFKKTEDKPNIVVIVVESLGADLFGVNKYGYTFTPFLDSLSRHSLLWTNCLSTTPRSFGAVPAITGSVPHGLKGFQFGNIPEYNSLFSVLKDNDYHTSAFYAGEFSFDRVYDYLISQHTDFLAPLKEDQKKEENKHYDYTYWGYHDKVMFEKSMEIIEQRKHDRPYFDLFMTVSQHDNYLRLNDKNRSEAYYNKAKEIIATLPANEQKKSNDILGHLAATIYTDDALKYFIEKYQQYNNNTIFVITGDHSLNTHSDNPIYAFHVPLIIWSPMLEKSARFNSVVSHNDIVPTLNALLRDNYNLKTPASIHWMGEELDTIKDFHCDIKTCFLRYTRTIFDGVYENYYFTTANNKKRLFLIKDRLELEEINDQTLIKEVSENFETLIYVDNYSYTNNKITKDILYPQSKFKQIKNYTIDSVFCTSNQEKPSIVKPVKTPILSKKIKGNYDEIKIVVTADIMYTGRVWQDEFINFGMEYTYDDDKKIVQCDNISKNISSKHYSPNKWMKMEFVKVLSTKDSKFNIFDIYLQPVNKDYLWHPEHSITLKNINIQILGTF